MSYVIGIMIVVGYACLGCLAVHDVVVAIRAKRLSCLVMCEVTGVDGDTADGKTKLVDIKAKGMLGGRTIQFMKRVTLKERLALIGIKEALKMKPGDKVYVFCNPSKPEREFEVSKDMHTKANYALEPAYWILIGTLTVVWIILVASLSAFGV